MELNLRRNPVVELNLRRNPVVANYQLLVELNLRRNPVASIDKLLVELNLRRNPPLIIYQKSQIDGEIQEVPITVEAHIYGEIQHY